MLKKSNLSSLIESSNIINSSLKLPNILNKVTLISKDILAAEAGSLMLLDNNTKELVFTVALGEKGNKLKKKVKIKLGQGIAGLTAMTGRPILVNDVSKDKRFFNWIDKFSGFKTHSIMCAPLKTKNKIIGVLEAINSKHKKGFSLKDLNLFQAFASQVAIAIDNANLHEEDLLKQRLNQELEIARDIQQNLLPQTLDISDIKIQAINIPAEQVGGDLYDFFVLGNNKIGAMISDVSGKGIPAALYMVKLMSEFRAIANSEQDLGIILGRLNNSLANKSVLGMFATLFYLVIDKANKKISYASAGHLPPLYYSDADKKIEYLDKAQNPPLGIIQSINYKSCEMDYNTNSHILLYTDGVTEARDKKGKEFSIKTLEGIFRNGDETDLIEKISNSLIKHSGNAPVHDDYTLVAVRL